MMYEDLIKRLRRCASYDPRFVIQDCEDAADAIEELQKVLNAVNDAHDEGYDLEGYDVGYWAGRRDYEPKWIPVTERLPEEYVDVLCYYKYFRYGDYNCMFRTIDRGYYGDGRWGGEAGQGHKNKVLAWMPLPEPPKEET